MDKELFNFLKDIIQLIQEKYDSTLDEVYDESELDKCYRNGTIFAYYDTLDLIESQIKAWSYI